MKRRILLILCGVVCIGLPDRVRAQGQKEAETIALMRLLEEPVDGKDFQEANGFGAALNLLQEKHTARGRDLTFWVNHDAFKKGTTARSILDGELPFRIPQLPRRLGTRALLNILLTQFEDVETTFLVRNGVVEILPAKLAAPKALLQRRVAGSHNQEPLGDVVQSLSYQTGASIVLDSRTADLARAPITATFRNDVTLEGALRMVTEMAELKLVVLAEGLFVTTPSHAEILQRERPGLGEPTKLGLSSTRP